MKQYWKCWQTKREPLGVIARRYGMSEQTLRNAKEQFLSGAKEGLDSKRERQKKNELDRLKKELAERNMIIGEYEVANRILKKSGRLLLNTELRNELDVELKSGNIRLTNLLGLLDVPKSTFYRKETTGKCGKPGLKPQKIPEALRTFVEIMAQIYDRWGYQKLAVICRRYRPVTNRQVYRILKEANMLKRRRPRKQEILESSKLYELLPQAPNVLWQMDVTYIYVNGYGWYYAVTVIDYFSRYLLACHFCTSYCSDEAIKALQKAGDEAVKVHGKLTVKPFLVTDNGSTFISAKFAQAIKGYFSHVRIQYRTPQQLGLLERFHETLKNEEVYYQPYNSPFEAKRD